MDNETIAKLGTMGCPVYTDASERIRQAGDGTRRPFIAIASGSAELTEAEIVAISVLIPFLGTLCGARPTQNASADADTLILRKDDAGKWSYRRASFGRKPWKPVASLMNIQEVL